MIQVKLIILDTKTCSLSIDQCSSFMKISVFEDKSLLLVSKGFEIRPVRFLQFVLWIFFGHPKLSLTKKENVGVMEFFFSHSKYVYYTILIHTIMFSINLIELNSFKY